MVTVANPRQPLATGFFDVPGEAPGKVAVGGNYAYVTEASGLHV